MKSGKSFIQQTSKDIGDAPVRDNLTCQWRVGQKGNAEFSPAGSLNENPSRTAAKWHTAKPLSLDLTHTKPPSASLEIQASHINKLAFCGQVAPAAAGRRIRNRRAAAMARVLRVLRASTEVGGVSLLRNRQFLSKAFLEPTEPRESSRRPEVQ